MNQQPLNKINRNCALANRLREVLLNGHWIANTNYKALIQDINWKQATQKVGNLNTIAALIFHVNYYLEGLLGVFEHGKLEISDKFSFDLPGIMSESDWEKLVTRLLINAEKFIKQIEIIPDHTLDETFVDEKYGTYLRNIEGVIEHSYYHLGQISLLKKMITTK
jgi:hypothetical protein